MSDFNITRDELEKNPIDDDDPQNMGLILDVLLDIRDLLMPTVLIAEAFDPKKYPNDLGPCEVEFCTEKAALIDFENPEFGKLFVPFSRMAPGIASACVEGAGFDEFRLGNWMFERLKEQAKEDRGGDRPRTLGDALDEEDIPF